MNDFYGDKSLRRIYEQVVKDIPGAYKKGTRLCLAGRHGIGKQLSLETELPTPNGFVRLADLRAGDELFDESGAICRVLKLHPVQTNRDRRVFGSQVAYLDQARSTRRKRKAYCKNHQGTVKNVKSRGQTRRSKPFYLLYGAAKIFGEKLAHKPLCFGMLAGRWYQTGRGCRVRRPGDLGQYRAVRIFHQSDQVYY
jgi:hypothetical protein